MTTSFRDIPVTTYMCAGAAPIASTWRQTTQDEGAKLTSQTKDILMHQRV